MKLLIAAALLIGISAHAELQYDGLSDRQSQNQNSGCLESNIQVLLAQASMLVKTQAQANLDKMVRVDDALTLIYGQCQMSAQDRAVVDKASNDLEVRIKELVAKSIHSRTRGYR